MKSDKHHWMPFFVHDWLNDRDVAKMDRAARSFYFDMLCHEWIGGPLPDSVEEVAAILKCLPRSLAPHWTSIRARFEVDSSSRLAHKKVESLRNRARKKSEQSSKAANDRWSRDADASQEIEKTHGKEEKRKEEKREKEQETPSAALSSDFDFEAVYLAYPGRSGKAKGIETLRKAIKSRDQYDAVLKAAARYGDEERRFKASGSKAFRPEVPYFSTWVNQRRWEDYDSADPLFAKPIAKSPAQILAEESRRQRLAEFEGQP